MSANHHRSARAVCMALSGVALAVLPLLPRSKGPGEPVGQGQLSRAVGLDKHKWVSDTMSCDEKHAYDAGAIVWNGCSEILEDAICIKCYPPYSVAHQITSYDFHVFYEPGIGPDQQASCGERDVGYCGYLNGMPACVALSPMGNCTPVTIFTSQAIDVRGPDVRRPIAPQVAISRIVGHDENDVRPQGALGLRVYRTR